MPLFKRRKTAIDLSNKKSRSYLGSLVVSPLIVLSLLLILITLFFAFHFYRKYAELRDVVQNVPAQNSINPAAAVISAVDKHMLLPSNEQPVLAQVSNLQALRENEFFKNAVVGDAVLVFCNNQLSILYSPSRDKIIGVLNSALPEACRNQKG